MEANTIICGDALEELVKLPACSAQTCVTSPPYFGLRDYGTAKWEDGNNDCDHEKAIEAWAYKNHAGSSGLHLGQNHQMNAGKARLHACPGCGARRVDKQIGLEETPAQYIEKLVAVFAEVRRVLRDDGLLWVNIGDSYGTGTRAARSRGNRGIGDATQKAQDAVPRVGGIAKNLMGIPWRLAFALQDQGWILRSDIIWNKPSAMPESVTDRPTKSHEYIFMFAKSERYYYDADAIREPCITDSNVRDRAKESSWASGALLTPIGKGLREWNHPNGRNARSVWTIASQPFKEAHFACMPPKLAERCILASTRTGDVVLDPFSGAGTAALVANNLNRKYIGIELNPAYVEMSRRRLVQPSLDFEWTA